MDYVDIILEFLDKNQALRCLLKFNRQLFKFYPTGIMSFSNFYCISLLLSYFPSGLTACNIYEVGPKNTQYMQSCSYGQPRKRV